jgi:hypothetical protein
MCGTDSVRMAIAMAFVLMICGYASHRSPLCANPARVVGTLARADQEGWVIVRADQSAEDTAVRIATRYHVRTQALSYLHGFSSYPVPQDPKFLCEKAVAEVHYVPLPSGGAPGRAGAY